MQRLPLVPGAGVFNREQVCSIESSSTAEQQHSSAEQSRPGLAKAFPPSACSNSTAEQQHSRPG